MSRQVPMSHLLNVLIRPCCSCSQYWNKWWKCSVPYLQYVCTYVVLLSREDNAWVAMATPIFQYNFFIKLSSNDQKSERSKAQKPRIPKVLKQKKSKNLKAQKPECPYARKSKSPMARPKAPNGLNLKFLTPSLCTMYIRRQCYWLLLLGGSGKFEMSGYLDSVQKDSFGSLNILNLRSRQALQFQVKLKSNVNF